MTSLFSPNRTTLNFFSVLAPLGEVLRKVPIETVRLDDVTEIEHIDFLKIDIQGAELQVFKSGTGKLKQAVAIQTEVSFICLYENQPTFGDIDIELRAQGFVPHCFAAIKRWPIAPCVVNGDPRRPLNQLLEADIVYVKNFFSQDALDNEQLKHLALIAHHCYGSFDLALRCIVHLETRGCLPVGSQQKYLASLSQPKSS